MLLPIWYLAAMESPTLSVTQHPGVELYIYASINNTLTLNGAIYFTNNEHYGGVNTNYGGGVFMGITSAFSILPNNCILGDNLPDCSKSDYTFPRTVYPSETFQVSVVAVGQRNGAVPSTVISIINQEFHTGLLPGSQHVQQANRTCTKLNYTVLSLSLNVSMVANVWLLLTEIHCIFQ